MPKLTRQVNLGTRRFRQCRPGYGTQGVALTEPRIRLRESGYGNVGKSTEMGRIPARGRSSAYVTVRHRERHLRRASRTFVEGQRTNRSRPRAGRRGWKEF